MVFALFLRNEATPIIFILLLNLFDTSPRISQHIEYIIVLSEGMITPTSQQDVPISRCLMFFRHAM